MRGLTRATTAPTSPRDPVKTKRRSSRPGRSQRATRRQPASRISSSVTGAAAAAGVLVLAYRAKVTPREIILVEPLPVEL